MQTKIEGEITLNFIMGGMSKKGNAYLKASNGEEAIFLFLDDSIEAEEFDNYERGDDITLVVERDFISDFGMKVLQVVS